MSRPGRKRSRPLITVAEFDALTALLPPLTKQQHQAVRLVLVNGHTMTEAGERTGFTRQYVSLLVKRFDSLLDAFELAKARHPGWGTITLSGPDELLKKWAAEAVEAAEAAKVLMAKRIAKKRARPKQAL